MKTVVASEHTTIATILMRAAEIIRRHGHCQGVFISPRGAVCMVQAVYDAENNLNSSEKHYAIPWVSGTGDRPAFRHLSKYLLGFGTSMPAASNHSISVICQWNNVPGRTKEQVIAMLEGAATWNGGHETK